MKLVQGGPVHFGPVKKTPRPGKPAGVENSWISGFCEADARSVKLRLLPQQ